MNRGGSFFYSISVNDRYRYPILMDKRSGKDSGPPVEENTLFDITEEFPSDEECRSLFGEEAGSLFEAFKRENKIKNCDKSVFCDDILGFLNDFFKKMKERTWKSLPDFLDHFSQYVELHDTQLRELMKTMNVDQLITPYFETNLPIHIIDEFNRLEQSDPRVRLYQQNPVYGSAIKEFGFFLDRYESTKELLCMFVWSTVDNAVVPMPAVGLNPYPLCWVCDKGFGTMSCQHCSVAKYCSEECQLAGWIRHGGAMCDLMASVFKKVKHLSFK